MQIIHHLTIDLARQLPMPPIGAVQNDANTRAVEISLLENGEPWNVPAGITAAVAFRKPDMTKGLYDTLPDKTKAVTITGSTVTAILAPQVLSCAGEVSAAVVFHDSKLNQLATFPFAIRVAGNPAAGQTVSNDYYRFSTMEAVSEGVEAALASMEESKQEFLAKAEEALSVVHDTATEDAPAIVCAAYGGLISVTDAAQRPLKGLTLCGKTAQNGTPTPENPVELVSAGASGEINTTVCGSNLFNVNAATEHARIKTTDGSVEILSSTSAQRASEFIPVCPNTVYVLNFSYYSSGDYGMAFYDKDKNFIKGQKQSDTGSSSANPFVFTTPENCAFIRFSTQSTYVPLESMSLNIGSVVLPFEPYKITQTLIASASNGLPGIPVSSGGNYTDESGQQWICDEVDFGRGVYVKRIQKMQITNTDMVTIVNYNSTTPGIQFVCQLSKTAGLRKCISPWIQYTSYGIDGGASTGCYIVGNATVTFVITKSFLHGYGAAAGDSASYKTAFDAWANELKTAGTPLEFQYALATPIETPLPAVEMAQFAALHGNYPNTTVFNDAGAGMKLSYVADTKTYMDQKIAAISAAMLNA